MARSCWLSGESTYPQLHTRLYGCVHIRIFLGRGLLLLDSHRNDKSLRSMHLRGFVPGIVVLFFRPCHASCVILVSWPGIEPVLAAVEAQSVNLWTAWVVTSWRKHCCLWPRWFGFLFFLMHLLVYISLTVCFINLTGHFSSEISAFLLNCF